MSGDQPVGSTETPAPVDHRAAGIAAIQAVGTDPAPDSEVQGADDTEFDAILARAAEIEQTTPAPKAEPAAQQPAAKPEAPKGTKDVDLSDVRRRLDDEFHTSVTNKTFKPLIDVVEKQAAQIRELQQERAQSEAAAYHQKVVQFARSLGDPRYGKGSEPVTPAQEKAITELHTVAAVRLSDSIEAAKADTTGKTKPLTWEGALQSAQESRAGKSAAVKSVQSSVQVRHAQRTFAPQGAPTTMPGSSGGNVNHRDQGIAKIRAVLG